ncbi:hypothetical protein HDK64DRAFT_117729 [Phyllosticta capitalensis]|uniref:Uncharacterized protein n=1 Tax=Phyllosticta capitalensis TaxID=121624 RepID=A0ABR1YL61_9PEZI
MMAWTVKIATCLPFFLPPASCRSSLLVVVVDHMTTSSLLSHPLPSQFSPSPSATTSITTTTTTPKPWQRSNAERSAQPTPQTKAQLLRQPSAAQPSPAVTDRRGVSRAIARQDKTDGAPIVPTYLPTYLVPRTEPCDGSLLAFLGEGQGAAMMTLRKNLREQTDGLE